MDCTIVTCFYEVKNSKHSIEKYKEWIDNFLFTNNSPIVIFCEEKYSEYLRNTRCNKPVFIIVKPFNQLYCNKWHEYWLKDLERDNEKYHTEEMYIIWHEKTKFVEEAIKLNPFNTYYFSWCVIGYFRESFLLEKYKNFPVIPEFFDMNRIHLTRHVKCRELYLHAINS